MTVWGIVKLTKSSSIDPEDTGLQPVANPPCWASKTAVSLSLNNTQVRQRHVGERLPVWTAEHQPRVVATPSCLGEDRHRPNVPGVRSQSVWDMTLRVNPDAAIRSMAGELRGRPVLLAENVRLPFTPRTPFTSGTWWVSTPFPLGPIAKIIPDEGTVTLMLITTKPSVVIDTL